MKRKLRSQTGASLILALFLFLICAVVGSVVLTAGTAASGRLSEISAMDQRYYAVTSAAEVLKDHITGSNNSVEVIKTVKTTESGSTTSTATYVINPLTNQYVLYTDEDDTLVTKAAKALEAGTTFTSPNMTLTAVGSESDSVLVVNVTEKVEKTGDSTGKMTLTVYNTDGTAGSQYKITLIFSGDIRTFVDSYEDENSSTTSTTTRVTWTLSGIKTG